MQGQERIINWHHISPKTQDPHANPAALTNIPGDRCTLPNVHGGYFQICTQALCSVCFSIKIKQPNLSKRNKTYPNQTFPQS